MGSTNSTRWKSHCKKYTAEEVLTLRLKIIYSSLKPGHSGIVLWGQGEKTIGSIAYRVFGVTSIPISVHLDYLANDQVISYPIYLTNTPLPWGGRRYWFSCPNQKCQKRVTTLHIKPGSNYFVCRHCNNLTYRSCQESKTWDNMLKKFGSELLDGFPYMTGKDAAALLEGRFSHYIHKMVSENVSKTWREPPDPYSHYLTTDELCLQSQLSLENLERLKKYRLLIPDKNEKYRPKLVQWAKKLAYLINDGWSLSEIKLWANKRFESDNPKRWPPSRST